MQRSLPFHGPTPRPLILNYAPPFPHPLINSSVAVAVLLAPHGLHAPQHGTDVSLHRGGIEAFAVRREFDVCQGAQFVDLGWTSVANRQTFGTNQANV